MNGKQKTFAVALSRQMAPSAHIVAYCIVEGEVVTDAMSFYVRDSRLMQVRVCDHFLIDHVYFSQLILLFFYAAGLPLT